jgi:predicted dinucleotide-binding enzyme
MRSSMKKRVPSQQIICGATEGSSGAELSQQAAPGAKVVKAFNSVFVSNQAEPVVDGFRLDVYVGGDDAEAKMTILELLKKIRWARVLPSTWSFLRLAAAIALQADG